MAIAFDVASSSSDSTGTLTTLTWAHTVAAGSDLALFVIVHWVDGLGTTTLNSVTYAGAAMTLVASSNLGSSGNCVAIYKKVNPSTGANNVVITWSASNAYQGGGASSWSGVDQTTPHGTAVTNSGTGSTASVVVGSAADEHVIAGIAAQATSAAAVSTDQTEMWERYSAGFETVLSGSRASGAATVTTNWSSVSPFAETWRTTGVSIKPASGGGGGGLSIPVAMASYRQRR